MCNLYSTILTYIRLQSNVVLILLSYYEYNFIIKINLNIK